MKRIVSRLAIVIALALTGCTHTRITGPVDDASRAGTQREIQGVYPPGRMMVTRDSMPGDEIHTKPPRALFPRTMWGISVGKWSVGNEGLMSVELHATRIRPMGVGLDFAIALEPRAIAFGAVVGAVDLGLAWALSSSHVTVCPRAGLSPIFAAGPGGGAGRMGSYGGVAVIVGQRIRVDLALRKYTEIEGSLKGISIGLAWPSH